MNGQGGFTQDLNELSRSLPLEASYYSQFEGHSENCFMDTDWPDDSNTFINNNCPIAVEVTDHTYESPLRSPTSNFTGLENNTDEYFYQSQDAPYKYDQSLEGLPLQNSEYTDYPIYCQQAPVYEELRASVPCNDPGQLCPQQQYATPPFESLENGPVYTSIEEDIFDALSTDELPWELSQISVNEFSALPPPSTSRGGDRDSPRSFGSSPIPPSPKGAECSGGELEHHIPEEKIKKWLKEVKVENSNRTRGPRSHEFLLRLLRDPYANPSIIAWDKPEEGVFRLVQKNLISKLWGQRKRKEGISYDNFARNLRYHYRNKTMEPVSEKHLVYRFGRKIMAKIERGEDV